MAAGNVKPSESMVSTIVLPSPPFRRLLSSSLALIFPRNATAAQQQPLPYAPQTCRCNDRGLTQIKFFPSFQGLSFATFSDGFDDGVEPTHDLDLINWNAQKTPNRSLVHISALRS
ncbi:hypothetical protein ACFX15_028996 [Malus domestica]